LRHSFANDFTAACSAFLALAGLCLGSNLALCQIPQNPPIPEGFGVSIHFTQPAPHELEAIQDAGFHWVRTDLTWSTTEKKPGVYDFTAYDTLIQALDRNHIRAMLILCYGNPLYDHGLSPSSDAGQAAFARWTVAAIHHFRGHGILWEIYNEPNYARFWLPKVNAQDYIRLALKVGEAVFESDPGELLVGPASATVDLQFLAECFQAGLLNYWAAVTVHPYRQRYPETVWADYYAVRWLIAKYAPPGRQIPIIPSEWGYSSRWKWDGMNSQAQATFLAREFLTDAADGIPLTFWYDWKDDNGAPNDPEGHFGLVKAQSGPDGQTHYQPKPAYKAAKALSEALGGFSFEQRLATGRQDDYVLAFRRRAQKRLAVWTVANKPHRLEIQGVTGKFKVLMMEGQKAKPLRARHGRIEFTVTGDPMYVISLKSQQITTKALRH
jgi:hypothetical protein